MGEEHRPLLFSDTCYSIAHILIHITPVVMGGNGAQRSWRPVDHLVRNSSRHYKSSRALRPSSSSQNSSILGGSSNVTVASTGERSSFFRFETDSKIFNNCETASGITAIHSFCKLCKFSNSSGIFIDRPSTS